ncbi:uncharacterized protein LOC110247148 isoform X2 [Exaiptasia diaphana]|uniref:SSD domain-containing protein n=1 Tax=Exaiptasia diaphana TaxID=2652724 RepID=A0A913YTB6_EXADI|nr:uncharacterized protein LOC110247148 isoform X2 [Exaiptasia diaphana]
MVQTENRYCKLILGYPKVCFALALGCHVVAVLATGLMISSGYDILPLDLSELPMKLENSDIKLQGDAWKFVTSDPRVTWSFENPSGHKEALRSSRYDPLEIYYQQQNNQNVLTTENLKEIQNFEESLFNNSVYQNKLCLLKPNTKCTKPSSIIRFFDGTYSNLHPNLFDPFFTNISNVLKTAILMLPTAKDHFSNDFKITTTVSTASALRSMFLTGNPFEGFKSTHDRQNEQLAKCRELAGDAFGSILDNTFKKGLGKLKIYYRMNSLVMNVIQRQVIWDLFLVAGSFAFIFVFMIVQTQSLWITGWSIFSIFSSFFGANIIYRILLDYRYIGIFHVLTVFIIAGIGADDVFVFYDTWRSSRDKGFPTILERFSFTYNHAAKAMLITSITTFVAFLTNVLSPLLAVSSFGVFSALIVMVNYISVIVFIPTVLITYELYWKDWKWPSLRYFKNKTSPSDGEGVAEQNNIRQSVDPTQKIAAFLGETFYSSVIGHKVLRWVVMSIGVAVISVSISFAVQLVPNEDQIDFMGPGSNWYDVRRLRDNSFNPSEEDQFFSVYVVWGLQNQDRSDCHFTDYKCAGNSVFDNSLDISNPPCQMALLGLCKEIETLSGEKLKSLNIRRDQVTNTPIVKCFLAAMESYFKQESKKAKYPNGTDLRLPFNMNKVEILMKHNPQIYNMSRISDEYYRYLEVAIAHWMTQGNTSYSNPDFKIYQKYIGGKLDTTLNASNIIQGTLAT